jgi:hypothetical protein
MKSLVLAGRGPLVDEAAVELLRTRVRPLETVVRWRGGGDGGDGAGDEDDDDNDDEQADGEKTASSQEQNQTQTQNQNENQQKKKKRKEKSWLEQRNPMVAALRGDDARIQVCEGTSCRLETDVSRI